MICLRTLLRIYEKKSNPKKLKIKSFLPAQSLVRLEASTKPHVHQKFEIFWTNIASAMACPNSKNGPKNGLRPLGVNMT
jgi:hypothetical protein